jgi:hypothetical protein
MLRDMLFLPAFAIGRISIYVATILQGRLPSKDSSLINPQSLSCTASRMQSCAMTVFPALLQLGVLPTQSLLMFATISGLAIHPTTPLHLPPAHPHFPHPPFSQVSNS